MNLLVYPRNLALAIGCKIAIDNYLRFKKLKVDQRQINRLAHVIVYTFEFMLEEDADKIDLDILIKEAGVIEDNRILSISSANKARHKRRKDKTQDYSLSTKEWHETLEYFNYECAYCGSNKNIHQDHVKAFSNGGKYIKNNIIPACSRCNCSKSNNDMETWYKSKEYFDGERLNKIKVFISKE